MTSLLDRMCLALCLWREARGESPLGRRLVACVIINRMTDRQQRWPRTARDVILQPLQFSSFNQADQQCVLYPQEDAIWKDCVNVADDALNGKLANMTAANHYHTLDVHPAWTAQCDPVIVEGHHAFYCL